MRFIIYRFLDQLEDLVQLFIWCMTKKLPDSTLFKCFSVGFTVIIWIPNYFHLDDWKLSDCRMVWSSNGIWLQNKGVWYEYESRIWELGIQIITVFDLKYFSGGPKILYVRVRLSKKVALSRLFTSSAVPKVESWERTSQIGESSLGPSCFEIVSCFRISSQHLIFCTF